jgi:hypothetical protein
MSWKALKVEYLYLYKGFVKGMWSEGAPILRTPEGQY